MTCLQRCQCCLNRRTRKYGRRCSRSRIPISWTGMSTRYSITIKNDTRTTPSTTKLSNFFGRITTVMLLQQMDPAHPYRAQRNSELLNVLVWSNGRCQQPSQIHQGRARLTHRQSIMMVASTFPISSSLFHCGRHSMSSEQVDLAKTSIQGMLLDALLPFDIGLACLRHCDLVENVHRIPYDAVYL